MEQPFPSNIFAMADLVISRAGSNAISELQALEKPMLLIPYPKAQTSRGDQMLNAENYFKRGLAHVLWQDGLTKETLITAIEQLYLHKETLINHLKSAPATNGTQQIFELIQTLEKKKK